ncbi:MAG: hypothetical protein IRY85_04775 [Micromonosporaceae bacterium]|nr:hypothetical protein [Micromonosporaceae bacterium]
MTATLKDLLTEYAEQARPYEVREQALRRGRRLRRMRMAAPAALAVLAVVATGLTVVALGRSVAPQHPAQTPSPVGPSPSVDASPPEPVWPTVPSLPPVVIDELERVSLPGYPAEIVTDPDARPLPADRAVGRGLTTYTNPAGPWYGLVSESGAQYRLELGDGVSHDLSPGGRWLVSSTRSDLLIRDLTGTTVATLPVPNASVRASWWWSPDDRWLLIAATTEPATGRPWLPPATASLVDLAQTPLAPREIDLRPWPGFAPAAVRVDGTIVLRPVGMDARDRLGELVLVDPDSGDGRSIVIDLSAAATPDELAATAYMMGFLGSGGFALPLPQLPDGSAMLQLWRSFGGPPLEAPTIETDVLVLDLDAGVVRERWHLPEPRPLPDNPRGDWESWGIRAVLPEGLLLTHSSTQRRWAWELYDPETGALSLVTDLRGLASAKQD